MKLSYVFLFIATLLCLSGCQSLNRDVAHAVAQPKIVYVVAEPGAELMADCELAATPPPKAEYLAATDAGRELLLATYIQSLQGAFAACAKKPKQYRDFLAEKKKIYGSSQ